jgi:hypothetical protein
MSSTRTDAVIGRRMATRLLAAGVSAACVALSLASPAATSINTDQFVLITTDGKFALQFDARGKKKQISVPREWLVPPRDEKEEESNYVSSFNYGPRITAFAMGNGKMGLHLSSFDLLQGGSAQAAAGRDVFLVFDPDASTVQRGLIGLGITKQRVREDGCFSARTAHFLLADTNKDGITDIGVVTELIECRIAQPAYSQHPVQWYVFSDGQWRMNPAYAGVLPQDSAALPLIGMELSPIDYVGYGYWKSHDPTTWGLLQNEPIPYEPPYRTRLIEGDARPRVDIPSTLPPELLAVRSGAITAHFGGERPPPGTPVEYGISTLWFTFAGDTHTYAFKPTGELYFSDWRSDVFSPDGAHVLLLQDRFGPYHVVATQRLKDFLMGSSGPDHMVTKSVPSHEPAMIHSDGHWVSSREISFVVSCCRTSEALSYRLP